MFKFWKSGPENRGFDNFAQEVLTRYKINENVLKTLRKKTG